MKNLRAISALATLAAALAAGAALASVGASPGAGPRGAAQDPQSFERQVERAEARYAEGSFELARRAYADFAREGLGAAQGRWVDFRLADCAWRAAAASENPDATQLEGARKALDDLLAGHWQRPEERDALWAEAHESLGDWSWDRRGYRDWSQAWQHYQSALGWWAASSDIEPARAHYLGIVRRILLPAGGGEWQSQSFVGYLPEQTLENAARIAVTAEERGWTHYFLGARSAQAGGDAIRHARTRTAFEAVLALGEESAWYDDALYAYGVWTEESGILKSDAERGIWTEPDYVGALEPYRRLVADRAQGESRFRDDAEERIGRITRPEVALSVGQGFLPESLRAFHLRWRNVGRIQLSLRELDVTRDVRLADQRGRAGAWLDTVDLARLETVASWEHVTGDDGRHRWGEADLRIEADLAPGAYVLEAYGGGARSRDLVLVSEASLLLKAHDGHVLAWFASVRDGAPITGARVALWERDRSDADWRRHAAVTDEEGLARFDLPPSARRREIFAGARAGERQGFALVDAPQAAGAGREWYLYAHTDRAAYRPGQTVSWKLVARRRAGSALETPAGAKLSFELVDPRGQVVETGDLALDRFGAAWGAFEPAATWTLGEYRVRYHSGELESKGRRHIGGEVLFRLEEYKLPEFLVRVVPPQDEHGRARALRVGDEGEAAIEAEYYFGGPVAAANVQVFVYQRPYTPRWSPPREFEWLHEGGDGRRGGDEWGGWGGWRGPGQLVKQEVLTTDAEGRAVVRFETPRGVAQDYEYTLEARVTDASRREVAGSGSVRATRQEHFVFPRLEHDLHRPGERATVAFKALDANESPVAVEGRGAVVLRRQVEVWIDPEGTEVTGDALAAARRRQAPFPPPGSGWRLKSRDYEEKTVATTSLRTDDEGEASWTFALPAEGYYAVRWSSRDAHGTPVEAGVTFFVATEKSQELWYRGRELEIIADKDTFHSGERAHVMLSTATSDRWVLFTVEAEGLIEARLVHVEGTVKLLELALDARHVPNVILAAAGYSGGLAHFDSLEIVVPPVEQFLDVAVELLPEELLPGAQGALAVTVRDRAGEPLAAQLALSLVDESVAAIQADYAGDPRQFFYGEKRRLGVATGSTLMARPLAHLVEDEKGGGLRDARFARLTDGDEGYRGPGDSLGLGEERMDGAAYALRASRGRAEGRAGAPGGPATPGPSGADDFFLGRAAQAEGGIAGGGGGAGAVQVRHDFRETALWLPNVVTGDDGRATVAVDYPDSLTNWRATARAIDPGARVGEGRGASRTRKPLVARLQAPRFLVVGDEVVLSVNLNNRSEEPLAVAPALEAQGLELLGFLDGGELRRAAPASVTIAAGGDVRLDWRARVTQAGEAKLVARAVGDSASDAVERRVPIQAHGIEALIARSGRLDGESVEVTLDLPAARGAGTTALEVQVAPSLAVTMLDALPYLVDYPYGCTEQTLSRFLPAVLVKRTLANLGLSPEAALSRVFGGIEREHVDRTQRATKSSLAELDAVVQAGLERLYDMQHEDGGWAWWKQGDSDPFMTAYVVWGLSLARGADVKVRANVLEAGARWLDLELVEAEERLDLAAWMLHALAAYHQGDPGKKGAQESHMGPAFENLYAQRTRLNAYSRALLALAAARTGRSGEAQVLARNLIDGAIIDRAPDASVVQRGGAQGGTASPRAHWGEDGIWRRWSEGGVEATAFALWALLAVDPGHELVQPAADWLIAGRRGANWSNTRDTAIVVMALDEFLRAKGELARSVSYEVAVNGESIARRELSGDALLAAPAAFVVPERLVRSGANRVDLRRAGGEGPLYFSVRARFFSAEEPVPPRGSELFVRRQYFRLASRPTLLSGNVFEREPIRDGDVLTSGERLEVVLTVEAKTPLEYLVFEDLKPAGLEATELASGQDLQARELRRDEVAQRFGDGTDERPGVGPRIPGSRSELGYTGRQIAVHRELRDRKVAVFVDKMPEGVWELRYDLRAEVPGAFHALPLVGQAMYIPEIRANGAEIRLGVVDRADLGR